MTVFLAICSILESRPRTCQELRVSWPQVCECGRSGTTTVSCAVAWMRERSFLFPPPTLITCSKWEIWLCGHKSRIAGPVVFGSSPLLSVLYGERMDIIPPGPTAWMVLLNHPHPSGLSLEMSFVPPTRIGSDPPSSPAGALWGSDRPLIVHATSQ